MLIYWMMIGKINKNSRNILFPYYKIREYDGILKALN